MVSFTVDLCATSRVQCTRLPVVWHSSAAGGNTVTTVDASSVAPLLSVTISVTVKLVEAVTGA
jgi:hypothetical protein